MLWEIGICTRLIWLISYPKIVRNVKLHAVIIFRNTHKTEWLPAAVIHTTRLAIEAYVNSIDTFHCSAVSNRRKTVVFLISRTFLTPELPLYCNVIIPISKLLILLLSLISCRPGWKGLIFCVCVCVCVRGEDAYLLILFELFALWDLLTSSKTLRCVALIKCGHITAFGKACRLPCLENTENNVMKRSFLGVLETIRKEDALLECWRLCVHIKLYTDKRERQAW
jgi:hypothetical protein